MADIEFLVGASAWIAVEREQAKGAAATWVPLRGSLVEPGAMNQELRGYSFFAEHKTVFIDEVEQLSKEAQAELTDAIRFLAPDITLTLAGSGKKAETFAKALKAELSVAIKNEPAGSFRPHSVEGAQPAKELLTLLNEIYHDKPLRLQRELEKIGLTQESGAVSIQEWREISSDPGSVDGWNFARSVMRKEIAKASEALDTWKATGGSGSNAGRDLLGALGYVVRQYLIFRLGLALGENAAAAAKKTPGRFSREDQHCASRWSLAELGTALSGLVELDRDLKSRPVPAEELLFYWCLKNIGSKAAEA